MVLGGWMDGCVDGWMGGWVGGGARSRIAYSNQQITKFKVNITIFKFFNPLTSFFLSFSPLIITPLWWGPYCILLTVYYSLFLSWPMLQSLQLLCRSLSLIADIVSYRLQYWCFVELCSREYDDICQTS